MPQAPQALIEDLERLGLARPAQFARAARYVRRLNRDFTDYESVWIDALVQSGALTQFQRGRIHGGRRQSLVVGPYVLRGELRRLGYADVYLAVERETDTQVELALATLDPEQVAAAVDRLKQIVAKCDQLRSSFVRPIIAVGQSGETLWAASPHSPARTLAELTARHGRLEPAGAVELARQLASALSDLETVDVVHGDVHARTVIVEPQSAATHGSPKQCAVKLCWPGLRTALRPHQASAEEDGSERELAADCYEARAPERIDGQVPSAAADGFSFGCVIWQVLAGRPAIAGATRTAKLAAARKLNLAPLRQFLAEPPVALEKLLHDCTQLDPAARPTSWLNGVVQLGPPEAAQRRALAQWAGAGQAGQSLPSWQAIARGLESPRTLAAAAAVAMALTILSWPSWREHVMQPVRRAFHTLADDRQPATSQAQRQEPDRTESYSAGQPAQPGPLPLAAANAATSIATAASPQNPGPKVESRPQTASTIPVSDTADDRAMPVSHSITATTSNMIVLPSEQPCRLKSIAFQAGQIARPAANQRTTWFVPADGIEIEGDEARFEHVDFVFRAGAAASLRFSGHKLRLTGCTFSTSGSASTASSASEPRPSSSVAAICWLPSPRSTGSHADVGHELALESCAFRGFDAAIEFGIATSVAISAVNCLFLGPGPALLWQTAPQGDASIQLGMRNSTLRSSMGLLEMPGPLEMQGSLEKRRSPHDVARIYLEFESCLMVPHRSAGLVVLSGDATVTRMLDTLRIVGRDAVVPHRATLVAWRRPDGQLTAIDTDDLDVQGLVRGEFAFKGSAGAGTGASRLVRWQIPLESAEPPGIQDDLPEFPLVSGTAEFAPDADVN